MRTEESAERLTNTPSTDDHSGYTVHDYTGQDVEVESPSITLGEAQFLAQSREESAACAKATISSPKDKDDSGDRAWLCRRWAGRKWWWWWWWGLRLPTAPGVSHRSLLLRGERLPRRLEDADGNRHG